MVKEYPNDIRNRAVGMILGGMSQTDVSRHLDINLRTIQRWFALCKKSKSLKNKPGRGRKTAFSKSSKIIIAKSLSKRHKSTRKLAKILQKRGQTVSHVTVYKYLKNTLHAKPFKPQKQPKMTNAQKKSRLQFCKERKNWDVKEWRRVLFSDESPYQLYYAPNRQNNRIWALKSRNVTPIETIKFPLKINVWGMMSHRALSNLHFIPRGQSLTSEYYVEEILKKSLMPTIRRKRLNGPICERKMLLNMSKSIFQQDGAPAHTAKKAQEWCLQNLKGFWKKGIWPANSPDLNPIENLWAILQNHLDLLDPPTNEESLKNNLKRAWSEINEDILDNLISSMPNRVRLCIANGGGYIKK